MIPSLLTDTVSFDLERAIHYALLWGLEGLELRSVGGARERVPHVNESRIKRRVIESELPVVAIDPGMFSESVDDRAGWLNEIVQFDETLQFCRRTSCDRIVVSSFRGAENADHAGAAGLETSNRNLEIAADAIRRAAEIAAPFGITLCVLNETGCLAYDGRTLGTLLDAVGSARVTAAWSPATAVLSGEDPNEGLAAIAGRVGLVRCRNGIVKGNAWEPRAIDSGEIDWPRQISLLSASGFDGPMSLEVEGAPQAKRGLHDATAIIRWLRSARREA